MICITCHLDKKKHSIELWELHQQSVDCTFCNKSSTEHSELLWRMHERVVENGQYCSFHNKNEKLYPVMIGLGPTAIARVCRLNASPPHDIDFVPIYMSCTNKTCGLYLGSVEEDYADILDGMCLKCFREETEQG